MNESTRNAYIGRCRTCGEAVAVGVEDEETRKEFIRDGLEIELVPLEAAKELFMRAKGCNCNKADELRAEVVELRKDRERLEWLLTSATDHQVVEIWAFSQNKDDRSIIDQAMKGKR